MGKDQRQDEIRRREAALAQTAQVHGGRAVAPRSLNQMISLRLEPELLKSLRDMAEQSGVSVSDVLRQAAADLVARRRLATFTFSTTETSVEQPNRVTFSERAETTAGVVLTNASRRVA